MTTTIAILLIFIVPLHVASRFYRAAGRAVFNFSLYPLVFSYFYLLVPSFVTAVTTVDQVLMLSYSSMRVVDQLALWAVFCFFVGHMLTRDPEFNFNFDVRLAPVTLKLSRLIQLAIALLMLFVLAKHGPSLLGMSGDRASSYDYYSKEIIDVYRLPILFGFGVISCSLLYLHTGRVSNLVPILLFVVLDALHGGRGYTYAGLFVCFANFLAANMKSFKTVGLLMLSVIALVFASAFLRRYIATDDTSDPLVAFFGEFIFTRMTAQFAYDSFLAAGDLSTYLLVSVSKLLPQFVVAPFFSEVELTPYHVILNGKTGIGFGLAGSVLAEALYYGGVEFAIVSPVLIATLFLFLDKSGFLRGVPGYLLFLAVVSSMYVFFRTGFYSNFFALCYMFIFYYPLMIVPSARVRVFLRVDGSETEA